jgi:hypothetical protein
MHYNIIGVNLQKGSIAPSFTKFLALLPILFWTIPIFQYDFGGFIVDFKMKQRLTQTTRMAL